MQLFAAVLTLFVFKFAIADERIYGGYPVDITQAPYMVHMTYIAVVYANGSGITYNCGGSILRKNLILTAGHCVTNLDTGEVFPANRFFIRAGSTYQNSGGTVYNVSRAFVHPKFRAGTNRRHHDVGLLELQDEIMISDSSKLVKLIHSGSDVSVGTDGIVSGWGINPDKAGDKHLNQVHLTVIDSEKCAREIGGDSPEGFEQHEICGQAPGKNFCQGDSGGPFLNTKTQEQIGIVSFGAEDCTDDRKPSVFCSVQDNMDFIKKIIRKTRRYNNN